jgi:hypothetical protein
MARDFTLVTAEQMDKMTPNERAELVRSRVITDLDELSPEFRERVLAKGQRIAQELRASRSDS